MKRADLKAILYLLLVQSAKMGSANQLLMGFEIRSRGNSHSKVKSIDGRVASVWAIEHALSPLLILYRLWVCLIGGFLCVCLKSAPMDVFLGYP